MNNSIYMEWVWSLRGDEWSSNEKLLLLFVTSFMDDNGRIEMSYNQAKEWTAIKTSEAIKNSINNLSEKHILIKERDGGGNQKSAYRLNLEEITPPEIREGVGKHPPLNHGGDGNHPPLNPPPSGRKDSETSEEAESESALLINKDINKDSLVLSTYGETLKILRDVEGYNLTLRQEETLFIWCEKNNFKPDLTLSIAQKFKDDFFIFIRPRDSKKVWCYLRKTDGHKSGYYQTIDGPFREWCKRESSFPKTNHAQTNGSIKDASHFQQLAKERNQ